MKEEDIHFMFNDIIQRSEQVLSQGAESELAIYHLPSLLESLASIVREMKQVCSDWLNIYNMSLSLLVVRALPLIVGTTSRNDI